MVRLVCLLRRRSDMTHDEFEAHWRDRHGPLLAATPTVARHLVRYEQHPRHDGRPLGPADDVDGVAVQTFATFDDFLAMVGEPDYDACIRPDEDRFLDRDRLEWAVVAEPRVVIGDQP